MISSLMFMAMAIAADDPPVYGTFTQRAKRLAQAASSVRSCENLGFKVDSFGIVSEAQHIVDDAVASGVAGPDAEAIMAATLKEEGDYQHDRAELAKNGGDTGRFLDYWLNRCRSLSDDAVFSRFFSRPEIDG